MDYLTAENIRVVAFFMLAIMIVSLLLLALVMALSARRLRNLDIPIDATFAETLHYTPFFVVVTIDLLDLVFDVLAAPASWLLLDRLGLRALRNVAAVEALIPGTQLIPTMTLCWVGVRLLRIRY